MARFTQRVALVAAASFTSTTSAHYTLQQDLSYKNFFPNFNLYSDVDPTHGFVSYQNYTSAIENKLVGYFEDTQSVYLGVNSLDKTPSGRPSIRAESSISFNQGLLLADIAHMPENVCGTWPAMWLLGNGTWPQNGEIDILEGVNDYDYNAVTLHTTKGCQVDNGTLSGNNGNTNQESAFEGFMATSNCDVAATDQSKNVGCSIHAPSKQSNAWQPTYGSDFNKAGGGIYAVQWTSSSISTWFFPRNSSTTQTLTSSNSSSSNSTTPDPSTFGTPLAKFSGSNCDFKQRFKDMRIIFNVAFCGDWAGANGEWNKSCAKKTGSAKCEDWVRDHPEAFGEVYWEIRGLRWFVDEDEGLEKRNRGGGGVGVKEKGRAYRW